ncbi:MAG: internalization-related competence protein ComEC/Rec2 protein, partial [Parcubacteria group bacterium GW2011_GWD2_43_10]
MKRIYYLLIGGVILLAAGWLLSFNHQAGLSVTFFDVGQGDAALIRTAEGQNILIDGGPS